MDFDRGPVQRLLGRRPVQSGRVERRLVVPNRRAASGPNALPHDAIRDLVPTFVSARADIDLVNQANLESAFRWAFGRRRLTTPEKLLTIEFSERPHRKLFEDVWRWAGRHCTTRTAGGVAADHAIPRLEKLFAELRNAHVQGADVAAERARSIRDGLHAISPYHDGNTRHSQLMADLYLHLLGEPPLAADDLPAPTRSRSTNAALKARRDELTALRLAEFRSGAQPSDQANAEVAPVALMTNWSRRLRAAGPRTD